LGWDFILASPEGGRQKICWFQAVPKAPNDTVAAGTYAFALHGTGPDHRADRDPEKAPAQSAGGSARRGLSALLFDDGNQLETTNQCIAIARAGRTSPEEKQLLEENATRRRGAAPPFSHDGALPSLTPSPNKSTP